MHFTFGDEKPSANSNYPWEHADHTVVALFEIIQKGSDDVTKKKKEDVKLQDMFEYSERQDKNCPLAQNEHVRVVRYKYRYALMTLYKSF